MTPASPSDPVPTASSVPPILDWTRPRDPAGVAIIAAVGAQYGVGLATLLRGTEVDPDRLDDPTHLFSGQQEVEVVRNLQAALPDHEHLGTLSGQRWHHTHYGALGLAYWCAPNLSTVLELSVVYKAVSGTMVESRERVEGDQVHIAFEASTLPVDVRRFYQQRDVASSMAILRGIQSRYGAEIPLPARYTFRAPLDPELLATYRTLFGELPQFEARETGFTVTIPELLRPLPGANARLHESQVAECERQLRDVAQRSLTTGQVRELLHRHLAEGHSLEDVAERMQVSARTLRRQLSQEGSQFRDILDEVRGQVADRLLSQTDQGIAQIAHTLGYESSPAFTAAFRRWRGCTPSQFRAERAETPS